MEEKVIQAGQAFSQVSGLLGGFSLTIMTLILSRLDIESKLRDWTVAIFLLAAGVYIFAAGILANTIFKEQVAFDTGLLLFHLANLCLVIGLALFVFQLKLRVAMIVALILCLAGAAVAIQNLVIILN